MIKSGVNSPVRHFRVHHTVIFCIGMHFRTIPYRVG